MTRKVLYRKYRPTKLSDVVGQEQVTDALANAIKQGKIGHAYLFIGPRGTGKTSVARIFAHAVNDFDYQVEDSYLDIIEIDAASNTGVDNIRELREKAVIAPTKGKYKVYIIDEVHMLTKSASNALLKTLEEPPEHVIFIMATTDAYKVPITISSRTQVFTFKLADSATMQAHLKRVAEQEGIKITDEALALVVRRGGGSFRDSLSLLDQVATLAEGEITAELLEKSLGLPQVQALNQLLEAYATGNGAEIQQLLRDLLNTGIKPETIASELIEIIIQNPQPAWLSLLKTLPEVQPPYPEAKILLALLSNSAVAANTTPTVRLAAAPTNRPAGTVAPRAAATPAAPAPRPAVRPKTTAPAKMPPITPAAQPANTVAAQVLDELEANRMTSSTSTVPSEPAASNDTTPSDSVPSNTAQSGPFDWESFLEAVHAENSAVYMQLQKVEYELVNEVLHLYPLQKFAKNILEKPGNGQILTRCLGSRAYVLHDVGEKQSPKDATLSQISAIMGDVREVNGDTPF